MHAHHRFAWIPSTEVEHEQVLKQLDLIVTSPHFRNSKRYPALLEYVVRETLAGRFDQLKERTIGVEVFQRPASYDTNSDPIVRIIAGEVRKRIAQFYYEKGPSSGIKIDLPSGTYVPDFHLLTSDAQPATASNSPIFSDTASLNDPSVIETLNGALKRKSIIRWIIVVACLGSILICSAIYRWQLPGRQAERFWKPILSSTNPVLFVLGQPSTPSDLTEDDDLYSAVRSGKNQIVLSDVVAVTQMSSLLDRKEHSHQLIQAKAASILDLRKGPVVLIGGLDNAWTIRLIKSLRFSMCTYPEGGPIPSPVPRIMGIADRKHEAGSPWTVDYRQPVEKITRDYAIIARFRSDVTDDFVIVAAGIGPYGTQSAGEFITSPTYMQQFNGRAPGSWSGENMEAVIETEVINGKAGHPHVVAAEFW